MYNFNPDVMQLDDGATGVRRVAGPRTDMSGFSTAEAEAASIEAGRELGLTEAQLQEGITDASKLTKLPGETNAQFNARVVQAYKDLSPKLELTPEEEAAGFKIQFVRTGAGGKGEYRKIRPLNFNVAAANAASGNNGFTFDEGDGVEGDGVGSTGLYTASDGKTFKDSDAFTVYQSGLDEKKANKVSAYNLLYDEFDKYGLGTLVSDIKNILVEGSLDPAEFALKVRGTDAYKARFIANEVRLAKGLKALSPAQYIALEDQYQEVMRQYGLPESYYAKTGTGVQEGFRKLIENDVSNVELEDRISTAQKRVLNANPEVTQALKQFYPDITNADILAYTLDPKNAIENIKRKVTAAEIGGAAIQSGLQTGVSRAEQLGAAGVTKDTAEKGFGTIAGGLQRGSQLASIYGESPYTQTTAEQEVFGLAGKTEAEKQRKKLTGLEKAAFGGQTGLTSGALVRDRAGAY
jgi:hypothetical protein